MGLLMHRFLNWWRNLWRTRPIFDMGLPDDVVVGHIAPPPPDPLPRQAPEPHWLDAICQQCGCTYQRSTFPTGEVQIMLLRGTETLAGRGQTTADAVLDVAKKARMLWAGQES